MTTADHEPSRDDREDFSAYRATVSQAVVALDVHAEDPDAFRGGLDVVQTGDIHLFTVNAGAHAVHRTEPLIAKAPQHYLKFTLVDAGQGLIVQDGRDTAVRAGDMAVYDTDKPYSLVFDDEIRMSIVMFPKDLLDIPAELLGRITATRFDGTSGVAAVVRPYLASLTQQLATVDAHVAHRLLRTAFDMVGTLLEAELGDATLTTEHGELRRRILTFIDEHLTEVDLGPTAIAAAHFISVRHLHALFREQGTTVSALIRSRRLERCHEELTSPGHATESVSKIALNNGFLDPAHFSRTFRRHFGVPPSSLRPQPR